MFKLLPLCLWPAVLLAAPPTTYDDAVKPVLAERCAMCHNEKAASGNLNIAAFLDPASLHSSREGWEKIAAKVRTGEMPPKGVPPLAADVREGFVHFIEAEFDRADRAARPDPGRVTARRLNRAEYSNTVRDLLGVEFNPEEFPPDDSGYGFDNIGDVLTVSPTLLEKYLRAAERIASRAIGADPLPKPGFLNRRHRVKRLAPGLIEAKDVVDFDADYVLRVLVTGHRGTDGKPVTLVISVDGKPVKTVPVESAFTLVNRQGGATQRTFEEARLFLLQGAHTFRAEFVNDEAFKALNLAGPAAMNPGRNIYPETFEVGGPFPPTAISRRMQPCPLESGAPCVTKILAPLVRRAYRRPVQPGEISKLVAVHVRALAAGYSPGQSLQFAIAAMLVSPQFLFRIERSPPAGTSARITDLELASRLSYFLWSSMPDDELLALAEAGRLHLPAVLDAQLKRMLASPKVAALADNFAGQWLETRSLDAIKPDPVKFAAFTPDLKEAMRTETRLFFEFVLRENRSITEFINGRYTFLNDQLARHYGIEGIAGGEFRRVELTTGQRGGVLTHASVLAVSSYPSRTSVVLRGKYLLENFLGAPPPAAPPDVPAIDEAAVGATKSLRQQMEQHRTNPVCASCHVRMDVLGFGLENYDAIGRWRTQDGKFPVDSAGTFPDGKSFQTPADMKEVLAANVPEFAHCLTEKLFTYALGRGPERFDRLTLRDIARQAGENDYRIQSIVTGIVKSLPFQARRGETLDAKIIKELARK